MTKILAKEEACNLRKNGHSIKEISKSLDIAQSTVSVWVRGIALDEAGRQLLKSKQEAGRRKAGETNRMRRVLRDKAIIDNCSVLKGGLDMDKDQAKIYLALLYWGEGAKTSSRLELMNSDPEMIRIFALLLRKAFEIDESKLSAYLHLHSYHDRDEMLDFWSKCAGIDKTRISIYNKKESGVVKNTDYKGCLALRYGNVAILREVLLIIDRFTKAVKN